MSRFVVLTSDGVLHETDDEAEYVALLDLYGPEADDLSSNPTESDS